MPLRRPHRKSRNGCTECKRRRVKVTYPEFYQCSPLTAQLQCNEQQPCQNCIKYDSNCVFRTNLEPERTSVCEGRLPSEADGAASAFVIGTMQLFAGPSRYELASTAEFAARDLKLMHHYTTSVSKTLSHRNDIQNAWAVALPQEAYTCDYLMHGLLALSALHLNSMDGSVRHGYAESSTYHLQRSLTRFRERLANISKKDSVPLFGMSSLMVVYVCAQSAMDEYLQQNGESSPSSLETLMKVINMCRGVETILSPYREEIRRSSLQPLLHEDYNLLSDLSSQRMTGQASTEEPHLAELADLIKHQVLETQEAEIYLNALLKLKISFHFMSVANQPLEPGVAFVWPIMLQRDFIHHLMELAPVALVLLAHYCVILHRLNSYWFLHGWHKSLLAEISKTLPSELQIWIQWPRKICGLEPIM